MANASSGASSHRSSKTTKKQTKPHSGDTNTPGNMANTYIRIYLHLVFAVKNRDALISPYREKQIHSYMAGTLYKLNHKPIIVGGIEDHVHILLSYNPNQTLPDLVKELKTGTTKFINNNHLCTFKFEWQRGYACFSYSHSMVDKVYKYIENQHQHHNGRSLQEELKSMLEGFGIEYDDQYIFSEPE